MDDWKRSSAPGWENPPRLLTRSSRHGKPPHPPGNPHPPRSRVSISDLGAEIETSELITVGDGGRVDFGRALSLITVVFNDGDRDIPLPGRAVVCSNMDFKKFKETISQKIGVEPHQIATFLIRRRKGRSSPDRKVPIDESTDFDALVNNTQDCHILAVLRKSPRRDRRGIPLPRMPLVLNPSSALSMLCSLLRTKRLHPPPITRALFSSSAVDPLKLSDDTAPSEPHQTPTSPFRRRHPAVASNPRPSHPNNPHCRMQECARMGNLDSTLHCLHHLQPPPDTDDYNAILCCYLISGSVDADRLSGVFARMKSSGSYPNPSTFNILFNRLCRLGVLRNAHTVIEEMCEHGFVPSFASLTKLLKKSLSSGLLDISVRAVDLMLGFRYQPSMLVLNGLICSLCRACMIAEAYGVFSLMTTQGFTPNTYSYNPLLLGLCKAGQRHTVLCLFCSLRKKGCELSVCTYTSLVVGFCEDGLWDDAYRVLEQMDEDGCAPTVVTYTVLINFLCKDDKISEALRVYEMMGRRDCQTDLVVCNVLLYSLCWHNRISEAGEMMQAMDEKGFLPDQYTHCSLGAGLLKAGHAKASRELLLNVIPVSEMVDAATCNVYIHSLCLSHRLREALSVLSLMMKSGLVPTNATHKTILKGFCMEKNIEEAVNYLDHVQQGISSFATDDSFKQNCFH